MLLKSVLGYGVAAIIAYVCWIGISKFINEKFDEITTQSKIIFWRNAVWVTSAFLWTTWLMHDVANIAVYLPRQLDISLLAIVLIYLSAPISMTVAPALTIVLICLMASLALKAKPPSLKESSVTLQIPISIGYLSRNVDLFSNNLLVYIRFIDPVKLVKNSIAFFMPMNL